MVSLMSIIDTIEIFIHFLQYSLVTRIVNKHTINSFTKLNYLLYYIIRTTSLYNVIEICKKNLHYILAFFQINEI